MGMEPKQVMEAASRLAERKGGTLRAITWLSDVAYYCGHYINGLDADDARKRAYRAYATILGGRLTLAFSAQEVL